MEDRSHVDVHLNHIPHRSRSHRWFTSRSSSTLPPVIPPGPSDDTPSRTKRYRKVISRLSSDTNHHTHWKTLLLNSSIWQTNQIPNKVYTLLQTFQGTILTLMLSEQYGHWPKAVSKETRLVGSPWSHDRRQLGWYGLRHLGLSQTRSGMLPVSPTPAIPASIRTVFRVGGAVLKWAFRVSDVRYGAAFISRVPINYTWKMSQK